MRNLCPLFVAMMLALTLAGTASARNQLELEGLLDVAFAASIQRTDLDSGGDLGNGVGLNVNAGLQAGEHLAFLVGYEWQTGDDYDTHYFPVTVRAYSPLLLERLRFYATAGLGLFFTRMHSEFTPNGNQRAAAFDAGGGFQVDISEQIALLVYARYQRGLGEVDDYESIIQGLGFQYRWGL
jgi:hypothetical protein